MKVPVQCDILIELCGWPVKYFKYMASAARQLYVITGGPLGQTMIGLDFLKNVMRGRRE